MKHKIKTNKQELNSHIDKLLNEFNSQFKSISLKNKYPYIAMILFKAILELEESVKKDTVFIYNKEEYNFFMKNY